MALQSFKSAIVSCTDGMSEMGAKSEGTFGCEKETFRGAFDNGKRAELAKISGLGFIKRGLRRGLINTEPAGIVGIGLIYMYRQVWQKAQYVGPNSAVYEFAAIAAQRSFMVISLHGTGG